MGFWNTFFTIRTSGHTADTARNTRATTREVRGLRQDSNRRSVEERLQFEERWRQNQQMLALQQEALKPPEQRAWEAQQQQIADQEWDRYVAAQRALPWYKRDPEYLKWHHDQFKVRQQQRLQRLDDMQDRHDRLFLTSRGRGKAQAKTRAKRIKKGRLSLPS